jgi:hypothetical protein
MSAKCRTIFRPHHVGELLDSIIGGKIASIFRANRTIERLAGTIFDETGTMEIGTRTIEAETGSMETINRTMEMLIGTIETINRTIFTPPSTPDSQPEIQKI